MSVEYHWKCDGCDKISVHTTNESPPANWRQPTVAITIGADAPISKNFDLCAACTGILMSQANPRLWARVSEVSRHGLCP